MRLQPSARIEPPPPAPIARPSRARRGSRAARRLRRSARAAAGTPSSSQPNVPSPPRRRRVGGDVHELRAVAQRAEVAGREEARPGVGGLGAVDAVELGRMADRLVHLELASARRRSRPSSRPAGHASARSSAAASSADARRLALEAERLDVLPAGLRARAAVGARVAADLDVAVVGRRARRSRRRTRRAPARRRRPRRRRSSLLLARARGRTPGATSTPACAQRLLGAQAELDLLLERHLERVALDRRRVLAARAARPGASSTAVGPRGARAANATARARRRRARPRRRAAGRRRSPRRRRRGRGRRCPRVSPSDDRVDARRSSSHRLRPAHDGPRVGVPGARAARFDGDSTKRAHGPTLTGHRFGSRRRDGAPCSTASATVYIDPRAADGPPPRHRHLLGRPADGRLLPRTSASGSSRRRSTSTTRTLPPLLRGRERPRPDAAHVLRVAARRPGRLGRGTLESIGLVTPAVDEECELEDPDGLRLELVPGRPAGALATSIALGNPALYAGLFDEDAPLALRCSRPPSRRSSAPASTHHVACRVADDAEQEAWRERLVRARPAADAGPRPQVLPLGLLPDARRAPDRVRDGRPGLPGRRAAGDARREARAPALARGRSGRRSSASFAVRSPSTRRYNAPRLALVAELVDAQG